MDEGCLRDRLKRLESTVASAAVKYIPKFCANDLFANLLIKLTTAFFYQDVGRYLPAANSDESAIEIALSLIGVSEDSQKQDYLFWKTAMLACL